MLRGSMSHVPNLPLLWASVLAIASCTPACGSSRAAGSARRAATSPGACDSWEPFVGDWITDGVRSAGSSTIEFPPVDGFRIECGQVITAADSIDDSECHIGASHLVRVVARWTDGWLEVFDGSEWSRFARFVSPTLLTGAHESERSGPWNYVRDTADIDAAFYEDVPLLYVSCPDAHVLGTVPRI